MKVKLCGFTEKTALEAAIKGGVDFVGFVFCKKSPRNLTLEDAASLGLVAGGGSVAKVAVVVDAKLNFLRDIYDALKPDYFQLHGKENLAEIAAIKEAFPGVGIIKAIAVENAKDIERGLDFADFVDFLLFDGKMAGSGKNWDFSLLKNFKFDKSWFLSGGLNANNILDAARVSGAKMVDISSGIEEIKGVKSPKLIAEILQKIKNNVD